MLNIGATEFHHYVFPQWADSLGWMVGASTLLPFAILIAYHLLKGEVSVICVMYHFRFYGLNNNNLRWTILLKYYNILDVKLHTT